MKLNFVVILSLVTLVAFCAARPAEPEYNDYEEGAEAPAPPPKKVPARPLVGRRNPIGGRNNKSTTTTTTPVPEKEEAEVAEGDYEDEQPEPSSSTTEAPKKFLKGGIVRPFRSNDDLLATLKRRREQAINNKHSKPVQIPEESAPAPVEKEPTPSKSSARVNSTGRRRFSKDNGKNSEPAPVEEPASPSTPARTGRRFHSRS